jgi:hypothetical protein
MKLTSQKPSQLSKVRYTISSKFSTFWQNTPSMSRSIAQM